MRLTSRNPTKALTTTVREGKRWNIEPSVNWSKWLYQSLPNTMQHCCSSLDTVIASSYALLSNSASKTLWLYDMLVRCGNSMGSLRHCCMLLRVWVVRKNTLKVDWGTSKRSKTEFTSCYMLSQFLYLYVRLRMRSGPEILQWKLNSCHEIVWLLVRFCSHYIQGVDIKIAKSWSQ